MRPAGKTNPLSLLLIVGVLAGIYWLIIFLPVYIDNLEVRDSVNKAFNTFGSQSRVDVLRYDMHVAFSDAKFGTHMALDPQTGEEKELPGLDISDDQITIDFDEPSNILTVRVVYDREVTLKPTDKKRKIHFVVEHVGTPLKK